MFIDLVLLTALLPTLPATEAVPTAVEPQPAVVAESHNLEAKAPVWTGTVNIGASYSDGNTESRSVNAAAEAVRRAEKDRWTAKGYWNYGEQRSSTGSGFDLSQRRAGASLKYDYFMSKKMYLFGIAGVETDTLAAIKLRTYVGGGVGYQWREDDELKWGSEVGLTYFKTDYKASDDTDYLAARIANNVAWKINDKTSLENSIEVFPSLEDAKDFYGKSDTKVKTNLSEKMFAQLQWIYQYTARPASGAERSDNLLVLGVGWSF
ncbi:MAG: DUF481 domain-containing protein [Planctomycetes bacterium]|nr:DUF481 domain-containing protein [Planctomycetota bacterium]